MTAKFKFFLALLLLASGPGLASPLPPPVTVLNESPTSFTADPVEQAVRLAWQRVGSPVLEA